MQENSILNSYNNQYLKMVLILCFVCVVMILSLSLNAFYNNGDDYYFLDISKNGEIIKNSIHGYFTWDGRFLSFSWIFQQFLFKYFFNFGLKSENPCFFKPFSVQYSSKKFSPFFKISKFKIKSSIFSSLAIISPLLHIM